MSKPIDLKTVKIFEPLSKKPEPLGFKEYSSLNPELVYEVLLKDKSSGASFLEELQNQNTISDAGLVIQDKVQES